MCEGGPLLLDWADVAVSRHVLHLDGWQVGAQAVLFGVIDGGAPAAGVSRAFSLNAGGLGLDVCLCSVV